MADGVTAWLSLGSNQGDRAGAIEAAFRRLDRLPGTRVVIRSRLYSTAPWGRTDQGAFLNAAAGLATALSPHDLLDACLGIERDLGRVRESRWGPRLIDIDVVHYAGVTVQDERLTLPHPLWRERAFVLVPLAAIAPDLAIGGIPVAVALGAVNASDVEPA